MNSSPAKMSIWGIGPKLVISTVGYSGLCYFIGMHFNLLRINADVYVKLQILGSMLLLVGGFYLLFASCELMRKFPEGKLMREGFYALVRNPVYSAWICFIIPGLVCFSKSYLMFSVPVFMYFLFSFLIKEEEKYLLDKFGAEYQEYQKRVPLLFPKFKLF